MTTVPDAFEDPLRQYAGRLRREHAEAVCACFNALLKRSGVDLRQNHATVLRLKGLLARLCRLRKHRKATTFLFVLSFCLVVSGVGALVLRYGNIAPELAERFPWMGLAGVLATVVGGVSMIPLKRRGTMLDACIADAESKAGACERLAWEQARPLNRLIDWEQPTELLRKVLPLLEPDAYFTLGRAEELTTVFGWDGTLDETCSARCVQSGEINGNPYLFAEIRRQTWGTRVYTGTKTIFWTERVRDSKGHLRTVTRSQVLTASVRKPIPEYSSETRLVYANDAAPNLCFSRGPTGYAGQRPGVVARFRKWRARARLEAFAKDLTDESQFTLMANRDFETLFHAPDRSDERAFRLLFTPLAQQRMVELLNDGKIGFGDDFVFVKKGKINVIAAKHLEELSPLLDPASIRHFDLSVVRQRFLSLHAAYFKGIYFAFAPLLLIPLYRQLRSQRTPFAAITRRTPAAWEQEAIANDYANVCFGHSERFATEVILKTSFHANREDDGGGTMTVTAHGFRTVDRVDRVSVRGGDGRIHEVPVHWQDYLPCCEKAQIEVFPTPDPQEVPDADHVDVWRAEIEAAGGLQGSVRCRRRLITYLR